MRREKEGGHGHRPCEESRDPGSAPVRRRQLQKSTSSILASNTLVRSAPKRVAVRVNGGLGGAGFGRAASNRLSSLHRVDRKGGWCLGLRRPQV